MHGKSNHKKRHGQIVRESFFYPKYLKHDFHCAISYKITWQALTDNSGAHFLPDMTIFIQLFIY